MFDLRIPHSGHVWLAQLDRHQTSKPLKVSVVSSILQLYILLKLFKNPQCRFRKNLQGHLTVL